MARPTWWSPIPRSMQGYRAARRAPPRCRSCHSRCRRARPAARGHPTPAALTERMLRFRNGDPDPTPSPSTWRGASSASGPSSRPSAPSEAPGPHTLTQSSFGSCLTASLTTARAPVNRRPIGNGVEPNEPSLYRCKPPPRRAYRRRPRFTEPSAFTSANGGNGARGRVPETEAEPPLSVRSSDLRGDAGQGRDAP